MWLDRSLTARLFLLSKWAGPPSAIRSIDIHSYHRLGSILTQKTAYTIAHVIDQRLIQLIRRGHIVPLIVLLCASFWLSGCGGLVNVVTATLETNHVPRAHTWCAYACRSVCQRDAHAGAGHNPNEDAPKRRARPR